MFIEPLALGLKVLLELVSPHSPVVTPHGTVNQLASKYSHGNFAGGSKVLLELCDVAAWTALTATVEGPGKAL